MQMANLARSMEVLCFRIGLVEDLELRLGWGGYLDSNADSGSNDGSLGFKYYINSEGDTLF